MDSPQSLPPPPPSSVPDAPFWVDYSTNSITVGWPQGKKSDLYHVQMGSIPSLDESAEGKEEKEAEEKVRYHTNPTKRSRLMIIISHRQRTRTD